MPEKRPNVFPQKEEPKEEPKIITPSLLVDTPHHDISIDSDYEAKRDVIAEEIYSTFQNATGMAAVDLMRERTEKQMKLRDEALRKNVEQTQDYHQRITELTEKSKTVLKSEVKSPINNLNVSKLTMPETPIQQLSQPQFNTAYDVIPLPSEGKTYKTKKKNVKVSYLTAADENILTSPNLLASGEFLEILINRKLLEPEIRYKDLLMGDRNAIMLWLRATSYGEMYPVTIFDEENEPFSTEINLNDLKTKKLGAEPDAEGYFDFMLKMAKVPIKLKLLTVGDIEEIQKLVGEDKEKELIVDNTNTYTLERQIVEVNGVRNRDAINEFVQNLRVRDASDIREYIEKIESGVILDINVRTPRGGSVETFLPLNVRFFWPKLSV